MRAIFSIITLLLGIAVILTGNGLLGILLGTRGALAGFSNFSLGLIMSGYFAGFMLGSLWCPAVIRRVGHIRLFAAMASMASVATLAHGLVVDPWAWFFLRVIGGFCIVGLYIAIESWLNQQTPNEQRGHVFSAYMTTTLIGLAAGQFLLLAASPLELTLFAMASVLLSLGLIPVALTRVPEPVVGQPSRLRISALYRISPLGVVGVIMAGVGTGAFWGLGPVFAARLDLPSLGIALYTGLTIIGGIVMLWPVGRLSDYLDRRVVLMWVCVLSALMAVAAWLLLGWSWQWMLLGAFGYGAFAFSIYSLSAAHTNDHLESDQVLEATTGLQLLWGMGAAVGPVLAGVVMQYLGAASFLLFLFAAALIPALFAIWRLRVAEAVPMEAQGEYVAQVATSPAVLEMHPEVEMAEDAPDKGQP